MPIFEVKTQPNGIAAISFLQKNVVCFWRSKWILPDSPRQELKYEVLNFHRYHDWRSSIGVQNSFHHSLCRFLHFFVFNLKHSMSRIYKATHERICVTSISDTVDGFTIDILGSVARNATYKVAFGNNGISCSCFDFVKRRKPCKHILCIFLKYLKWQSETIELLQDDLLNLTDISRPQEIHKHRRNSDCNICYETIDYDNQQWVYCKLECGNSLHAHCFKDYSDYKKRQDEAVTCPTCRAHWVSIQ